MIRPEFHYYDAVASTNDLAIELARQGAAEGTVVIARQQLSGRGRRGRVWIDEPGQCVLMSTLLRPNVDIARLSGLSFVASLGVAEWLSSEMTIDARLKWPNDVLVEGKKIAGILVELTQTARGHAAVAGTGVNINQRSFPEELAETATSAAILTGGVYEIPEIAESLASYILRVYEDFLCAGFEEIVGRWRNYMWGVGETVEITTESRTLRGAIHGLGSCGELLIADSDNAILAVHAADTIKTTRN